MAGAILAASVVLPGRPVPARTFLPPQGETHLTESQALDSARGGAALPAAARLMDYRSAAALLGEGPDPRLSPVAPVWVVTVYQPRQYTVILNGVNGLVIDSCMGCRSL
ncbi:MAG TPA: hypothetical protein VET24_03990 [Actinomycetota bacterium]|nr:hypothetical protein [Actinomycetota bacterium]